MEVRLTSEVRAPLGAAFGQLSPALDHPGRAQREPGGHRLPAPLGAARLVEQPERRVGAQQVAAVHYDVAVRPGLRDHQQIGGGTQRDGLGIVETAQGVTLGRGVDHPHTERCSGEPDSRVLPDQPQHFTNSRGNRLDALLGCPSVDLRVCGSGRRIRVPSPRDRLVAGPADGGGGAVVRW
ncbi:hypothetical protein IU433_14515 [Nocardia puris]|uniref:hypothetical protein n=1 Tax=Nocardia puris TaxID=208602 RepID=UPI001895AE8E|nr:hypothetical protein [Nocardia puris]MBF6364810.1 hypothetical protein [Nocardia puris]MBF6460251.1 hypothetical protein [Nocardia puris]